MKVVNSFAHKKLSIRFYNQDRNVWRLQHKPKYE